jgi:hypothetical protein
VELRKKYFILHDRYFSQFDEKDIGFCLVIRVVLRVHQMIALILLEYGCNAYGAALNSQLKRLEPIYNQGLRIAIGASVLHQ